MNKPTPTRHGAWRVIDGQLVDESTVTGNGPVDAPEIEQIPPGEPAPVLELEQRTAEPGESLPPIDTAPAKSHSRRKAPSNAQ